MDLPEEEERRGMPEKDDDDDDMSKDDYDFEEEVQLPQELQSLHNVVFSFEQDLEEELQRRGFLDRRVVLDPATGKARLAMSTGAHHKMIVEYAQLFEDDWRGVASVVHSGTNICIQRPASGRKMYMRCPDLAFWGPAKTANVQKRGRHMSVPVTLDQSQQQYATRDFMQRVHPDVVLQFSWRRSDSYERKAMDDMMNFCAVVAQNDNCAPKLGYFVKIRTKGKQRTADNRLILRAIDVYRIPQGATVKDAEKNAKGATFSRYIPGGPDVVITVTPEDLGIPPGTPCPRTFDIYASDMFNDLA